MLSKFLITYWVLSAFYCFFRDKSVVETTLREMVTAICNDFFEPTKNDLVPQSG